MSSIGTGYDYEYEVGRSGGREGVIIFFGVLVGVIAVFGIAFGGSSYYEAHHVPTKTKVCTSSGCVVYSDAVRDQGGCIWDGDFSRSICGTYTTQKI